MMSRVLLAVSSVLVFVGIGAGCSPDVPANPTYTKDVQPIYLAHCVRCHGANDMLTPMPVNGSTHPPKFCYLQRYEDEGDCSMVTNPDCKMGAGSVVCDPISYVTRSDSSRMPPPPSEPLNDWEKEVITRWVNSGAPQ
jgi:hypothetical protein